jgi:hypothetical protein
MTREFVLGLLTHDGRMLTLLSLDSILPALEAQAA